MRTLAIGLAALALLGGRKTEGPDTQINAAQKLADGTFYVGADMNGKSVAMAVGDALRVELESIPTAGYVWQVAGQPDFLEHVGDGMRATDPEVQDQPGYVVVVGDFNATMQHAPFRDLLDTGLRDAHLERGDGWAATFPADRSFPPVLRIDHVLVGDDVEVLEVGSGDATGSDHKPVWAVLALTS